MIQDILGYFVRPEHLYQAWVQDMNAGNFEVQKVTDSLNQFERSIAFTMIQMISKVSSRAQLLI